MVLLVILQTIIDRYNKYYISSINTKLNDIYKITSADKSTELRNIIKNSDLLRY